MHAGRVDDMMTVHRLRTLRSVEVQLKKVFVAPPSRAVSCASSFFIFVSCCENNKGGNKVRKKSKRNIQNKTTSMRIKITSLPSTLTVTFELCSITLFINSYYALTDRSTEATM